MCNGKNRAKTNAYDTQKSYTKMGERKMKRLILDRQLRHFASDELEEACRGIQNILGVTSGDVAGVVFSGFDWNQATIEQRMDKLREYVRTEIAYAD
jgi:hypothetical protein